MAKTDLERFMAKAYQEPNTGCWLFSCCGSDGYGTFYYEQKVQRAHRAAYKMFRGQIPEKTEVCHSCDVPSCVNPAHLFLGSHLDNMTDMYRKNRRIAARGDKCRSTILTPEKVKLIRASTSPVKTMASEYGVSTILIYQIRRGLKWKWVK